MGVHDFIPDAAPAYLEHMLALWKKNPKSVSAEWRALFESLGETVDPEPSSVNGQSLQSTSASGLEAKAHALVRAYRERGHIVATSDPLNLSNPQSHPDLEPASHGLGDETGGEAVDLKGDAHLGRTTVSGLIEQLRNIYCGTLSCEFMHLDDPAPRAWLQHAMETGAGAPDDKSRIDILNHILRADVFESFMQTKFPTAKRYGMEGSESQLPLAEQILAEAASLNVSEIVIGPMHRGRTTFMATFMEKPLAAVFAEFKGQPWHPATLDIAGDVSYHMGRTVERALDDRIIRLSMCDHPSHVETVIPVALGRTRARQRQKADDERRQVLGLMMHTDAGFAGQGVVAECFQLSNVQGYRTGGSVHVIINNQIGFTTDQRDARSSRYCSDMGKIIQAPVLRVNGDDPEAAHRAATLAVRFWAEFQRDIIIDFVCYRRQGHNELDEPRYTQPGNYETIEKRPTVRQLYGDLLRTKNLVTAEWEDTRERDYRAELSAGFDNAETYRPNTAGSGSTPALPFRRVTEAETEHPDPGVHTDKLRELSKRVHRLPDGFTVHRNLARQLKERATTVEQGTGITWATAELLALGSLLDEGTPVRLTGEDTRRGTFSQRHAVLLDQITNAEYVPLQNLSSPQAAFEVFDSPLSEAAVLGYEYGYSLADVESLVLWEAQFGDFVNVAQSFIDHYISCGEEKWLAQSGLVLLLPHGLEGGGPEHSSARPERFLQLCARYNMQVVNCTTPANHFHVLRRQMKRDFRKPLIAMTPKRMLRDRAAVSDIDTLCPGTNFQPVIADPAMMSKTGSIEKIILCSGRLYYDLDAARREKQLESVALVRLEELYPFPHVQLTAIIAAHPQAEIIWCQEEPENAGAWSFLDRRLECVLAAAKHSGGNARYVGRPASPTPAAASRAVYEREQDAVIATALQSG